MKNEKIYKIKTGNGLRGIASGIWNTASSDKTLTGMILVTVLAIVGTAIDRNYTINVGSKSLNINPDDRNRKKD